MEQAVSLNLNGGTAGGGRIKNLKQNLAAAVIVGVEYEQCQLTVCDLIAAVILSITAYTLYYYV